MIKTCENCNYSKNLKTDMMWLFTVCNKPGRGITKDCAPSLGYPCWEGIQSQK